ncbi:OmpA family protein [Mangrovivirga cuniculi]|uniref:OmpA-like domain-containing protein n=1 Tax=Mangrovivirga cuniculi TaxID=2715131 RepID=A0A4D7JZ79_9BACT|nr:OmpA family protein [Mangrovivirga cuniculi]QCK13984.1 hypothetical protein DCC35_04060 [Mangrovivirga cuniculi]
MRFFLVFTFLFLTVTDLAIAQKKDKKKGRSYNIVSPEQSLLKKTDSTYVFEFSNINRLDYFADAKLQKKILEWDRKKDWENLYPTLEIYVANFGVENFFKDNYLLWRLAKLAEHFGETEKSKYYYRLVLKHHREDLDIGKTELHYDSLTKNEKDYYVPLEYYYELVDFRKEIDTLRPPRGVLLNMGKQVNSKTPDYGPTLSADDATLIFTSKRNVHKTSMMEVRENEDLFFTKFKDGGWEESEPFVGVNTQYNEGSACISRDGQTLYFVRCNSPDSYGNCDIFEAKLQSDSTWGEIKNLGQKVNSVNWDSHPSLSVTEDTLFFASDRIEGFGLSDIYYTVRQNDNSWGKPYNLGPVVNTNGNEVSPYYDHKYKVLYFSSTGQLLRFGGFDIYKSYYKKGAWAEPKNVGPLVNGPGNEYYFTIDSKADLLFYAKSSDTQNNDLDLHSFPLPMGAQPAANTLFAGRLEGMEGQKFEGIVSVIDIENGIEVAPKFLRDDGTFAFDLIDNQKYLIILQGDNFFRIEEIFTVEGDMTVEFEAQEINATMEFESVVFDNGKAEIKPEMHSDLDKVGNFLLDHPNYMLTIAGHTDSDGNPAANKDLSQRRAEAIKDFLIGFYRIDADRIEAIGYGSDKPLVKEKTEEDKQLNRRVEFQIERPPKMSK